MQKRPYDAFTLYNTLLFYSSSFKVRPRKLHVKFTICYKGIPDFHFSRHWKTGTQVSHWKREEN